VFRHYRCIKTTTAAAAAATSLACHGLGENLLSLAKGMRFTRIVYVIYCQGNA